MKQVVSRRLRSRLSLPSLLGGIAMLGALGHVLAVFHIVTVPPIWRDLVLPELAYVSGCAVIWMRVRGRESPLLMQALALAMTLAVFCQGYLGYLAANGIARPWPSAAEVFRLLFVGCAYVAIGLHARNNARRWHQSIWWDGLIISVTISAYAAQFLVDPLSHLTAGTSTAAAAMLLYPLSDLALISSAITMLFLLGRSRVDAMTTLTVAALGGLTIGDVVFLNRTAQGIYHPGEPLDVCNTLAAAAVAAAIAWAPLNVYPNNVDRDDSVLGRLLVAVPLFGGALALLLLQPLGTWQAQPLAKVLAGATLVVIGLRTLMTYRELWSLAEARDQARTDELTGLLNRRGFAAAARGVLKTQDDDAEIALLLVNLVEFREVNDSLGFESGDAVLSSMGERLRDGAPAEWVLARLSGDEFAVLLPDTGASAANAAAEAMLEWLLTEPIAVGEARIKVEARIGIAAERCTDAVLDSLLRSADLALQAAKEQPRLTHVVYDAARFEQERVNRLRRLSDLRRALDAEHGAELLLFYQPKIVLRSGKVEGVEALIRWQHPELGLLTPDRFLPLADESGLMPRITETVLEQAVREASALRGLGHPLNVSVNLPAAAIVDAGLPARVAELLRRHQLPPNSLTLEITEESLLSDRVRARVVLAELRTLGVSISIDDYGTGYSSLAYLRELPVDELKLDRSFVQPMSQDRRAAAIVRSTVDLAHSLGLKIVAEGVEHEDAAQQLHTYGCDNAQGFHYSKPVPPEQLVRWLSQQVQAAGDTDLLNAQTAVVTRQTRGEGSQLDVVPPQGVRPVDVVSHARD